MPGIGSRSRALRTLRIAALEPVVDFRVDVLARLPVALLDPADELVARAGSLIEIVVGELAPLLLHLTSDLLPLALPDVVVHVRFLDSSCVDTRGAYDARRSQ